MGNITTTTDASASFSQVNDPLNAPVPNTIAFRAAAINMPAPLVELQQSQNVASFGNSQLGQRLVALNNITPPPSGPAPVLETKQQFG